MHPHSFVPYLINLERSPDRLATMKKEFESNDYILQKKSQPSSTNAL